MGPDGSWWWLHVWDEAPGAWCPAIGQPRPECPVQARGPHSQLSQCQRAAGDWSSQPENWQLVLVTTQWQKHMRSCDLVTWWPQRDWEVNMRKTAINICALLLWRQKEETVWYFTKVSPILLIESVNFWHKINLCCKFSELDLAVTQWDDKSCKIDFERCSLFKFLFFVSTSLIWFKMEGII